MSDTILYHRYMRSDRSGRGIRHCRRNSDYALIGSQYAHVAIWQRHHGVILDPVVFIVHHKDEDKRNNQTCGDTSGHCPNWACGNLAPMTRADHIREHRPGRMGGRRIPNKQPARVYRCEDCGQEKSRKGRWCRACYLAAV